MTFDRRSLRTWSKRAIWLLPAVAFGWVISLATSGSPPEPIPPPTEKTRFGLTEERRRKVFDALAKHRQTWRRQANGRFSNHPWKAEDDFRNKMRAAVERYTGRFDLDRTTIWLIVDEGVRKGWKGPDGEPFRATTVPLHTRK